jgi:hypothetical protein
MITHHVPFRELDDDIIKDVNKGEPQEMLNKISRTRHELPRPTL